MTGHGCARAVALLGINGAIIEVEASLTAGPARLRVIGLPGTWATQTRSRIRAAIGGQAWPAGSLTAMLAPASIPKPGNGYDLAIAIAALRADGTVSKANRRAEEVFIAELDPDGSLVPVRGIMPMVQALSRAGFTHVCVAEANAAEAALVPGIDVVGLRTLRQAIAYANRAPIPAEPVSPRPAVWPAPALHLDTSAPAIAEPPESGVARLALEVGAAGGHHLLLLGDSTAPKAEMAALLAQLLPPMDERSALQVAALRSLAGVLDPAQGLDTAPPYCVARPTATAMTVLGGGSGVIRPGAASLAHRGVLVLDSAPEFARAVLDGLRESIESGEVVIQRAGRTATFPARYIMVATSNPCPCTGPECACSPRRRSAYLGRIAGPLLDRIDLRVAVHQSGPAHVPTAPTGGEPGRTTTHMAERVQEARQRAARRLKDTPWQLNAEVPARHLRAHLPPDPDSLEAAQDALACGVLTVRGFDRVLRVAWSLADLAGRDRPGSVEMDAALGFRLGASTRLI